MTCRLAQPVDRAAIEDCFRQLQDFERTIEPNRADSQAISREYVDDLLAKCAQHAGAIFVAEEEGQTVGFVCVLGRVESDEIIEAERAYAYVTDLFVVPGHRGNGTGEQLMNAAEAHARSSGARRLRVGVLATNPSGFRFYRKRGFRESELVLEKLLEQP